MRNKVTFEANIPVELSLAYPQGKIVEGTYGPQSMFGLSFPEQSIMFLDLGVAQKITNLEIQPGERFFICKRPKNGSTPMRWDIWLSPATETMRASKQLDRQIDEPPSMLERQLAASVHEAQTRRMPPQTQQAAPAARGNGTTGPVAMPRPAAPPISGLVAEANALVDAYAEVLDRALRQYEGRIKPDEVRSMVVSAYIQRGKHGAA